MLRDGRGRIAAVWVGSLGFFGQALDKVPQGNSTFRGKGEHSPPPKQTPSPQADPAALGWDWEPLRPAPSHTCGRWGEAESPDHMG